jgi:hypothetical protein
MKAQTPTTHELAVSRPEPERFSHPDDFAPDDIITPAQFDHFVRWAADELEPVARHRAFDYEPGQHHHVVRLEDAIGDTIDIVCDSRCPEAPVSVLMRAIRRHVYGLKRRWDGPDSDEIDTFGPKVMLDEARTWARLPWNASANDVYTVLRRSAVNVRIRSRPRERRSRRLRSRSSSRGDPSGDPSDPSELTRSPGGAR